MSGNDFESLEKILEAHVPEAELRNVRKLLFGKELKWVTHTFTTECRLHAPEFSHEWRDVRWRL